MTINQMFWTLYIAGLFCILLCTGPNLLPMAIFIVVGLTCRTIAFVGGTHNG